MAIAAAGPKSAGSGGLMKSKNSKPEEIRRSNIQAAKALSDAVRTSLGPRGMDKMIQVIMSARCAICSSTIWSLCTTRSVQFSDSVFD